SDDPRYNHAIVRNVEVTVHDNDQPDIQLMQLDPLTTVPVDPQHPYGYAVDNNSVVLEGTSATIASAVSPVVPANKATELFDLYAVQRAKAPTGTVRVAINPSDDRVVLESADPLGRFHTVSDPAYRTPGVYCVEFNAGNWNNPVLIKLHALNDNRA